VTNLDVLVRTVSEVTGRSEDYVRMVALTTFEVAGTDTSKLMQEIPDEEAERLLSGFRKEKAGILNWLLEGRRRAIWKLQRYYGH